MMRNISFENRNTFSLQFSDSIFILKVIMIAVWKKTNTNICGIILLKKKSKLFNKNEVEL